MTQTEIIEMARKSDFEIHPDNLITFDGIDCTSELIAFAKLVAEKAIKEALAQPEQKYHRGDRLICLETEEYCVIHISGTDRQWVKFPDSHIGVYTNEQVAELFEFLPKEPEQEPVAWEQFYPDIGKPKFVAQPEQEPVAWIDEERKIIYWHNTHEADDYNGFKRTTPLYTTPPQRKPLTDEDGGEAATKLQQKQETIEGLNRDYDLLFAEHQLLLKKEWVGLTDEEEMQLYNGSYGMSELFDAIEAKLKQKNGYTEEKNK